MTHDNTIDFIGDSYFTCDYHNADFSKYI